MDLKIGEIDMTRNEEDILDMIKVLIGAIIFIFVLLAIDKTIDKFRYNDGYCSCGGKWEYIQAVGHNYSTNYVYKCEKCGYMHRNKVAPKDNRETVRLIASHQWRRSLFQR